MITQAYAVACGGPRTIDCDLYMDSGGDFNFFGVLVVIIIIAILYSRS